MLSGMSDIDPPVVDEQLRIVDSLREHSDLPDEVWASVRKEIEQHGLEGAGVTARQQIAVAMLKARNVISKGDFVGHPFRGNQWSDSSGAGIDGAGGQISAFATSMHSQLLGTSSADRKKGFNESVALGARDLLTLPEPSLA